MSGTVTVQSQQTTDEIITDKHAIEIKHKMMSKLKMNALLGSIAESCKFVAGPLFGCGVVMAVSAGAMTLGAGALLAVAAGFLLAGVASGYASTRIWQSGQFDNFELNAQSTARHLVQELNHSHVKIVEEHSQNVRRDNKTWVQATGKESLAPAQPQVLPQGT